MYYCDLTSISNEKELERSWKYIDKLSLNTSVKLLPKMIKMDEKFFYLKVEVYDEEKLSIKYVELHPKTEGKGESVIYNLFIENVMFAVCKVLEYLIVNKAIEIDSEFNMKGNKKIFEFYRHIIDKAEDIDNSLFKE